MKLINESILHSFEKGSGDNLSSLGVGKISQIQTWLKNANIDKYKINPDLSIDVFEDIYELNDSIPDGELPKYINFNKVNGEMSVTGCGLVSLRGFPKIVTDYFSISGNQLKSLKGGPEYCGFDCVISQNPISSLEFAPKHIGGSFYCGNTNISSEDLEKYKKSESVCDLILESQSSNFERGGNDKLASMGVGTQIFKIKQWLYDVNIENYKINKDLSIDVYEDVCCDEEFGLVDGSLPPYINFNYASGEFVLQFLWLKSLRGFPKKVEEYFSVSNNEIDSLEGGPEYVENDFDISNNPLTSLEFAPKYIGGSFCCDKTNINYNELSKYVKNAEIHGDILGKEKELYESYNKFERGRQNKLSTLGVGKIKLIKKWLEEEGVVNWKINDDLTIDVDGDVDLPTRNVTTNFPEYIKFNKIKGFFDCFYRKMTTLKGCPNYVGSYFACNYNNLNSSSIQYFPEYVGDNVNISHNYFNLRDISELKRQYNSVRSDFQKI